MEAGVLGHLSERVRTPVELGYKRRLGHAIDQSPQRMAENVRGIMSIIKSAF